MLLPSHEATMTETERVARQPVWRKLRRPPAGCRPPPMLHLVPLTWMFVITLMAAAEALGGSVLGALVTWVFYGALPAGLLAWLLGAPLRRRARLLSEQVSAETNGRDHAAGHAVAPIREE